MRFYRAADGTSVWLAEVAEDAAPDLPAADAAGRAATAFPPYDVAHYLAVLQTSYVSRLRKAYAPDDFAQLFRPSGQAGLFDRPLAEIRPHWIQA